MSLRGRNSYKTMNRDAIGSHTLLRSFPLLTCLLAKHDSCKLLVFNDCRHWQISLSSKWLYKSFVSKLKRVFLPVCCSKIIMRNFCEIIAKFFSLRTMGTYTERFLDLFLQKKTKRKKLNHHYFCALAKIIPVQQINEAWVLIRSTWCLRHLIEQTINLSFSQFLIAFLVLHIVSDDFPKKFDPI